MTLRTVAELRLRPESRDSGARADRQALTDIASRPAPAAGACALAQLVRAGSGVISLKRLSQNVIYVIVARAR